MLAKIHKRVPRPAPTKGTVLETLAPLEGVISTFIFITRAFEIGLVQKSVLWKTESRRL